MAFTQTEIDALKAAIAQGALRVRFGDREVMYRSLAEMLQTLSMMQAEVAGATGQRRTRQVRFVTGKGLR
jgi:hypothetical protein